jgi:hypothetical protein
MRKALWLFTPFTVLAAFSSADTVIDTAETPAELQSLAEFAAGSLYGTWDTAPYFGPVPEAPGYGFSCCTAVVVIEPEVDGFPVPPPPPGTLFSVFDIEDSTSSVDDGYFYDDIEDSNGLLLEVEGTPVPLVGGLGPRDSLDPVPEPHPLALVGAGVALMLVWEFRRRKAARGRRPAALS